MRHDEFAKEGDDEMWANGKPLKSNGWDKTTNPKDPKDFRPTPKDELGRSKSKLNLNNIGPVSHTRKGRQNKSITSAPIPGAGKK